MERGDMMAYRIVYGPEQAIRKNHNSSTRVRVMIAMSFLLFAWTVRLLWPEGRNLLMKCLLPGDVTRTEAAFIELLRNVRQGFGLADSLTVFCREVLYEII